MVSQERLNQLTEVLHLYYEQNLNQKEISKIMNVSVSTVSRMLKEAQELGMVEIIIKYPYATIPSLAKELKAKFNLKDAYVLPTTGATYYDLVQSLGQVAAVVLDNYFKEKSTLGISLGLSVAATIRAYNGGQKKGSRIVRFQGAADFEIMEGTNLAQVLAEKVNGRAMVVPAPWLLPTPEVCEALINEPAVKRYLTMAEEANLGLVGMGSMDPSHSTILRNQLITLKELNEFRAAGAVGEICGKHYDRNGQILDLEFNKRTVSIQLTDLARIETVIGVAASIYKVDPLLGAIRGGLINVVITDSDAARAMLARNNH
ncbi:MAG: winged helix-turn-helix transcriptional regulator [Anaerolineales bacterium]|nr:winged helix-turn-helix transcriptional regulator [Anaerolineales bacterium]